MLQCSEGSVTKSIYNKKTSFGWITHQNLQAHLKDIIRGYLNFLQFAFELRSNLFCQDFDNRISPDSRVPF